jgi:hypothetical protein
MILRHLRVVIALIFPALAVAVCAAPGVSQAATVGSSSPSASAPGRIGIKLLDVPSSQADNPRDEEYIVDQLAPGTVIHRKFEVVNLGSAPVQLLVYPAAASIANGSFQFASGHTQNLMTTWLSLSQGTLTLAPHSNATIEATITVPGNAPSGGQYGVIWAQESSTGAGNVLLVSRVGIRIYLTIGPGGAAPSDFTLGTPVTSRTPAGAPVVRVPVHNTGGVAVDVRGTLQLNGGPGGVSAGPFSASAVLTLAPGQSGQDTFDLSSHLPEGSWQGSFTMVSGLTTKTEKVTLDFTAAAATITATAAHNPFPIVPVAGAIAAVIILAIAALLVTRSRRDDTGQESVLACSGGMQLGGPVPGQAR